MSAPLQKQVAKGATGQSAYLRFTNQISGVPQVSMSEGTAGLILKYVRVGDLTAAEGGTSIAPVSLGALSQAWNPGGIKHLADGNYRVDIPDAAFAKAVGVTGVLVIGTATAIVSEGAFIQLVDGDRAPVASTPQSY